MKFYKFFTLLTLFFVLSTYGQKKEDVLFTIDGDEVNTPEFIRVYKKNKDIVVENEKKNFEDYFNLFVDFKLKLKQAYDLKLDTSKVYQEELKKYREQLIEPYLQNPEAIKALLQEAYDRTLEEVDASHILIRIAPDAEPKDTIISFQKITNIRNSILGGVDFELAAKQYSEDPSAKENGGNLGYFSAFGMVYPFENAAYQTEVGSVSQPFRTQFGYHILKVNDKRKSLGQVQVAHIMVKNNPKDSTFAEIKILEIYKKLEQGDDFANIAKEHSDDASSAQKGGTLPQFGTGRMIKPFEDVAFSLQKEGDFSKPFNTEYGWHILKLVKKIPIGSYENLEKGLESKIMSGNRSKYVDKALAKTLEDTYTITENLDELSVLYSKITSKSTADKPLLTIEKQHYTTSNYSDYLSKNQKKNSKEAYDDFRTKMIIDYHKEHLEETNKEFGVLFKEYRDGLLLFELLQVNVWGKSEKDSIGLQTYFEKNKENYFWKKRGELTIASCTSKEKAQLVKKYLEEGRSQNEIKDLLNEGATIHVLFSSGTLEEGNKKLPSEYQLEEGVSKIYEDDKNHFTIIKVTSILPSSPKKLEETKGEVINDYQLFIEEEWVKALRKQYKVKINERNYKKLKEQYLEL